MSSRLSSRTGRSQKREMLNATESAMRAYQDSLRERYQCRSSLAGRDTDKRQSIDRSSRVGLKNSELNGGVHIFDCGLTYSTDFKRQDVEECKE